MAEVYRRVQGKPGGPIQKAIALNPLVQRTLDDYAIDIAEAAQGFLDDAHIRTGTAQIELSKGDVDSYITLVDTNVTNDEDAKSNSALSIEYGRAGYIDQDGERYGEMKGLYVLARAANLPKKNKKGKLKKRARNKKMRGE